MSDSTQLFVRSNIHAANLDTALKKNLQLGKFVDVTLSCEGRKFKCHRLILAAASPLFESLFLDNPAQHPIVIIPYGIKPWTLQALIEFMYKGHVNVSQCGLRELVYCAELLKISGLGNALNDFPNGTNDNRKRSPDAGVPPERYSSDNSESDTDSPKFDDFKSRDNRSPERHMPTDADIPHTNLAPVGSNTTMTEEVAKIRVKSNQMLLQNPKESTPRGTQGGILRTESSECLIKCEAVDLEEIECHPNMDEMCSIDMQNDSRLQDYEDDADPILEFDAAISTDTDYELSHEGNVVRQSGLHRNPLTDGTNGAPQFLAPKKCTQRYQHQFYDSLKIGNSPSKRKHKLYKTNVAGEPGNKLPRNHDELCPNDPQTYPTMEPTLETVILRNPRGNQPRSYSTQSLYDALMAVKRGESIYRASREFIIPRKTLRNWMKRWNIKSQFPMPKQLKDAAIRKKIQDN